MISDLSSHECVLKEFLTMCRYLIFCVSAVALPTKGNLPSLVRKAMKEAGSPENIFLWCFLTPDQIETLLKSHLVFVACWGTGKTLLMVKKARDLNKRGEKVLILIFLDGREIEIGQKTLLILDLEKKLEEECRENVTIKGVNYMDGEKMTDVEGNEISTEGYDHVFVDEFFEDLLLLSQSSIEEFNRLISNKKTVWVSLSNSYNKPSIADIGKDPGKI